MIYKYKAQNQHYFLLLHHEYAAIYFSGLQNIAQVNFIENFADYDTKSGMKKYLAKGY